MVLTQNAKNIILANTAALFTEGGVGLSETPEVTSDTGLFGGGTIIDGCNAITGWNSSGDADSVVLNTNSGYFVEGTGCLNLPSTFSSGIASYSKSMNKDLSNKKMYLWFYIDDVTDLADSETAITIDLGTGGFTNYSTWNNANSDFTNGWNSIYVDCSNPDTNTGSGVTISNITDFRININLISSQVDADMRMDYWRFYEADTLGITDSIKTLQKVIGVNYFKTSMNIPTTESNGVDIKESGDTNGTTLLSRQTFATITKGFNTQIQVDKFYYIE